ncbi:pantoate-beta-alanine ligase [Rhizophagus clarus]|uniref:Pantoate--beta-alanine ligase n=1 Tax=Rhizophagus clarus TaxID=94130 RepID=A0A8H3KQP6_9GLOM|nr:pantoate-beta-alanine ligase [Rhizophagus clarus]
MIGWLSKFFAGFRSMSFQKEIHSIKTIETIPSFRSWRRQFMKQDKQVAFVPTMGSLHEGHLKLVKLASEHCPIVVVSIFVNPAQFAPNEDLDKYPRTLSHDLELLRSLNCVDTVFLPKVKDIYPSGIPLEIEKQKGTFVEVKGKSHQLEGTTRPSFFRGVSTVVAKLFNIVQPDHVFFGQKDAQQCIVIRSLISDLHFPIEMHVGPTKREHDGLAMSSRNQYLTPEMRNYAITLYNALTTIKDELDKGKRNREILLSKGYEIVEEATQKVKEKNLGFELKLDYLSIADPTTLDELQEIEEGKGAIISGALFVGRTRVLDNLLFNCTL